MLASRHAPRTTGFADAGVVSAALSNATGDPCQHMRRSVLLTLSAVIGDCMAVSALRNVTRLSLPGREAAEIHSYGAEFSMKHLMLIMLASPLWS